jgi:hypothetical protein
MLLKLQSNWSISGAGSDVLINTLIDQVLILKKTWYKGSSFAGMIIAVILLLVLQIPLSDYIVDDAFIHLTFARNIAEGHGFSFNPDVPTYGITAPLWTLLLALLSTVFYPGQVMVKTLSILFGVLTIPAFRRLASNIGLPHRTAIIITIAWAVNVWLVRWTASGMEATLALLLLILAFNAQLEDRYISGLWLGIAILCRPEAVVLIVIFGLDRLWNFDVVKALKLVGITAATLIPWHLYALITFGTLLPNPARVKAGFTLASLADFLYGLKRACFIIGGAHFIELLIILGFITAFVLHKLKLNSKEIRVLSLFIIWASFSVIIYLVQGVFVTSRYLLVGLPPVIMLAFMLLESEGNQFRSMYRIKGRYILVSIMIIIQLFLTWRITLPHVESFKPTISSLKRIAGILNDETLPESSVAVGDVGIIGFFGGRYLIDLEGLVTQEMIPFRVGRTLDDLVLSGRYLKMRKADYLLDKSQNPNRMLNVSYPQYSIITIEEVPGGLVDSAHEKWYYTLYRIDYSDKEKNSNPLD